MFTILALGLFFDLAILFRKIDLAILGFDESYFLLIKGHNALPYVPYAQLVFLL